MLKKYGFIMLLLLGLCGVHSALASCAFTTPTGTYIDQTMASSPVTAVTLTSTNLQQLFQSSVLVGGPVISTCNPSTGTAISVSGDSFSSGPLSETMPDGGLLIGGIGDGFGYGFWYTVTYGDGSGSVSGHLKKGGMFNATPAQLNGARWEFQAELWYVGGSYGDKVKKSQIVAVNTTYFKVGFSNVMKGFRFNSPAIPITPVTCELSLDTSQVDFGEFSSVSKAKRKSVRLFANTCNMVTRMELRILSNGNPVDTKQNLLLNKLTGENAASGFGLSLYPEYPYPESRYPLDVALGKGRMPANWYPIDGGYGEQFLRNGSFDIYLMLQPDGAPLKAGDFEATATINVSYY